MQPNQKSLAAKGWLIVCISLMVFGGPMLMEMIVRPIWVLADPSCSIVHHSMPWMISGIAIGLVLVIIDAVRSSSGAAY